MKIWRNRYRTILSPVHITRKILFFIIIFSILFIIFCVIFYYSYWNFFLLCLYTFFISVQLTMYVFSTHTINLVAWCILLGCVIPCVIGGFPARNISYHLHFWKVFCLYNLYCIVNFCQQINYYITLHFHKILGKANIVEIVNQ